MCIFVILSGFRISCKSSRDYLKRTFFVCYLGLCRIARNAYWSLSIQLAIIECVRCILGGFIITKDCSEVSALRIYSKSNASKWLQIIMWRLLRGSLAESNISSWPLFVVRISMPRMSQGLKILTNPSGFSQHNFSVAWLYTGLAVAVPTVVEVCRVTTRNGTCVAGRGILDRGDHLRRRCSW